MSKAPKKPATMAYPKKPKAKAPMAAFDNYNKKVAEVDKINYKRIAEYRKALKAHENEAKRKKAIIAKADKSKTKTLSGLR